MSKDPSANPILDTDDSIRPSATKAESPTSVNGSSKLSEATTLEPPKSEAMTSEAIEIEQRLDQLDQLAAGLSSETDTSDDFASLWPTDFCLSIIVPVYNEAATISQMLHRLVSLEMPKEIIIVDDGSSDGTPDVLRQWHGQRNITVVLKPQNEGKGAAIRTGFAHVGGSLVIVQDADLEYDPADIPSLMLPILSGSADVVYGSRFLEARHEGSSFVHQFGNRFLTTLSNFATGLKLTDMETCYKVFSANVLNDLEICQDRFGFEPEITAKLARRGLRFAEVPVNYHARDWTEGKKIGVSDGINAIFCILRYALAE